MMLLSKQSFLHSLMLACIGTHAAFFYPDPQASLLEHILVDTHSAHASGFASAITPCTNYVSGAQTLGRETAAQWIRVAFHDFVTAHVAEGTGGVDASIGFETLREEDSGSAMNDSLGFFRPYVNSKISMADLIAISVTMSVGNCGGSQIPVRGGRIDATEAGPFGVPAPDTSLELTLEYFSGAGFNQVDSIGLTACGHTLGSVHHGGFPTVVGPEAVTPNNTAGGIHFDSTVAVFDPLVVHEYLNGTGNQGGPLVTSFNISSRSDLRLYESDNNATMINLANQGEGFLDTCTALLQRMIETVPSNVVLSEVISPIAVKPTNATLDFDAQGNLIFSGSVRILTPATSTAPSSISLAFSFHSQPITLISEALTGSSVFGSTSFFPFSVNISNPDAFESFTVLVPGLSNETFHVQTQAFVVPSLTSANNTSAAFTVAVRSGYNTTNMPSVKVSAPVPQMGTLGPAIASFDDVPVTNIGRKGLHDLFEGSVLLDASATGAIAVDIIEAGEVLDTLLL